MTIRGLVISARTVRATTSIKLLSTGIWEMNVARHPITLVHFVHLNQKERITSLHMLKQCTKMKNRFGFLHDELFTPFNVTVVAFTKYYWIGTWLSFSPCLLFCIVTILFTLSNFKVVLISVFIWVIYINAGVDYNIFYWFIL